jgi:hypothetical protein
MAAPWLLASSAVLLALLSSWLAFVLIAPRQWSDYVDRAHEQFIRFRLIPVAWSEYVKQVDKGPALKVILVCAVLAAAINLALIVARDLFGFAL